MKLRWNDKYLKIGLTAFLVIAASMLFYYGIFHMPNWLEKIQVFLSIMAPIIYGIALAYVMNPVVNFLENKIIYPFLEKKEKHLEKRGKKLVRWTCVLLSLVFLLMIIYALVMMILPQLIRSIMSIIYSFPYYANSIDKWINSFIERGGKIDEEMLATVAQVSAELQEYLTNNILPQMQNMLKNISSGVFDVLIFLKNFLIGAIVSLYVLADKEIFVARSKMVTYALLPTRWANSIIHSMRFTHHTFGGFFSGKILDSAIIGVICYIGSVIIDFPYAVLISVVVGVTNIIPFFGPYLGAVPCFILIFMVSPIKSLYFILFILVLQQFDGNILGPKILGESTGLSSFMVIVSILIGGGLFGVPGMIVGVPIGAVIYASLWKLIEHALGAKEMPNELMQYCNVDCFDPEEQEMKELVRSAPKKKERTNPNSVFMKIWNFLCKILLSIWSVLKKFGSKIDHFIKNHGKKYYDALYEKLRSTYHKIKERIQRLDQKIREFSKLYYQKCKEKLLEIYGKLKEMIQKLSNKQKKNDSEEQD